MGKCDNCGNPSKYTCPACQKRSCSVNCVRVHKISSGCTGSLDPTRFIPKPDLLTPATLDRDYNFLQKIGREIVVEKSDAKQFRVFKPRDQWRAGARVHSMAKGMTRSVANKSHWDASTKQFEWTVEVIDGINRQLFQVGDQTMVSALPALFGAPESYMIKLRDYYGNELTLNKTQTFQQALKGKNVLEFPTLVISDDIESSSDSSYGSESSDSSGSNVDRKSQSRSTLAVHNPTQDVFDNNKKKASDNSDVNTIDNGKPDASGNEHLAKYMHNTISLNGGGNETAYMDNSTANSVINRALCISGISDNRDNSNDEQSRTTHATTNPSNINSNDTTSLESNNRIGQYTANVIDDDSPANIGNEISVDASNGISTTAINPITTIVDSTNAVNGVLAHAINSSNTGDEISRSARNIDSAIDGANLFTTLEQTNPLVADDRNDSSEEPEEQSAKHI